MILDINGFKMAYQSQGKGTPLLLIHGFPLSKKMWEPQLQSLSLNANVLAPDLRGHGESEPVAGPYSMDLLADDYISFLDALEIEQPVVVCGHSMGGYITLAMYRRHPDRIRGLILAATRAGADSPDGKASRENAIAKAKEEGPAAIASAMLPKMMSPTTYQSNPDLVEQVDNLMSNTSLQGIVGALEAMKERPDSTPMLAKITVPTLIIHGEDDQLIPSQEAQSMHTSIADSNLYLISNAGHLPNLEQPDRFNQIVKGFTENL
jgi:pimeloyl-ACP methyl ester carboxylesterase